MSLLDKQSYLTGDFNYSVYLFYNKRIMRSYLNCITQNWAIDIFVKMC